VNKPKQSGDDSIQLVQEGSRGGGGGGTEGGKKVGPKNVFNGRGNCLAYSCSDTFIVT
jgi:hypothetical protein